MITQEIVRDRFGCLDDGTLIHKTNAGRAVAGSAAGTLNGDGYLRISICGHRYAAHRIIWLWHYGYLPENDIDHRNRERTRNTVGNLREVSRQCNIRNTGNWVTNTSGVKGVIRSKNSGLWEARIVSGSRKYHLGRFRDFLEAVCHRLAAEQALDWAGCDECSPAFHYVKNHIKHIK